MTKLNWRDASKELPEEDTPCLVINACNLISDGCYFSDDNLWLVYSHDVQHTVGFETKDVKYWIYLDEIPLPEE